jgi:DNA transposition AAA+ family ATPase
MSDVLDVVRKEEVYDARLYERFLSWSQLEGISLKKAATLLSRSEAVVQSYIDCDLPNDHLKKFEADLIVLMNKKQDRRYASPGDVVELSTSKKILEGFEFCRSERQMGAFIGPAGVGKTVMAVKYSRQHRGSTFITADITRRSVSAIVGLLAGVENAGFWGATTSDLLSRVIDKVRYQGELILIDEAQNLGPEAFEVLRTVWDRAQVGLVMLGTPRLYSEMRDRRKQYQWDQVTSRIGITVNLDRILFEDVLKLTNYLFPGLKKPCIEFLYEKALEGGRFRTVSMLLKQLHYICRLEQAPASLQLLKQIASF